MTDDSESFTDPDSCAPPPPGTEAEVAPARTPTICLHLRVRHLRCRPRNRAASTSTRHALRKLVTTAPARGSLTIAEANADPVRGARSVTRTKIDAPLPPPETGGIRASSSPARGARRSRSAYSRLTAMTTGISPADRSVSSGQRIGNPGSRRSGPTRARSPRCRLVLGGRRTTAPLTCMRRKRYPWDWPAVNPAADVPYSERAYPSADLFDLEVQHEDSENPLLVSWCPLVTVRRRCARVWQQQLRLVLGHVERSSSKGSGGSSTTAASPSAAASANPQRSAALVPSRHQVRRAPSRWPPTPATRPTSSSASDGHTDHRDGRRPHQGARERSWDSRRATSSMPPSTAIIPGLAAGKYDLGASSFTDTKAREKDGGLRGPTSQAGDVVLHQELRAAPPSLRSVLDICGDTVSVEKWHNRG